jgi:hypothetical protein
VDCSRGSGCGCGCIVGERVLVCVGVSCAIDSVGRGVPGSGVALGVGEAYDLGGWGSGADVGRLAGGIVGIKVPPG